MHIPAADAYSGLEKYKFLIMPMHIPAADAYSCLGKYKFLIMPMHFPAADVNSAADVNTGLWNETKP